MGAMSAEKRPQAPHEWARLAATLLCCLLVVACVGLVTPLLAEVQIQYFRHATECALSAAGETACASQAATAQGFSQSTSSLGTLLLAPYYGAQSDKLGRGLFFRVGLVAQVVPFLMLGICLEDLRPFYVLQALSGFAPNNVAMFFTVLADLVSPSDRMQYFGLAVACFLGAFSIGAGLSAVLQPAVGSGGLIRAGALFMTVFSLIAALLLPETLPQQREEEEDEDPMPVVRSKSLARIIVRPADTSNERLLHAIALIGLLSSIPEAGTPSIALFYAKAHLHLSGQDVSALGARMLCIVGLSGFLWQSVGLSALRRICPNTLWIYQAALFTNMLHMIGYLVAWAPWVIVANGLFAGGPLAQPTILRGFVSQALPANVQGYASGVLSGVEAACRVAGPALFSGLFLIGGQAGAPWLPWAFGMGLVVAGSLCAARHLDCHVAPEASGPTERLLAA